MKKYLWKERFALDAPENIDAGWTALIDEENITKASYNGKGFVLVDESKEDFLALYNKVIEPISMQGFAQKLGFVPVFLLSTDNKTIVTDEKVYESYDEMLKDYPDYERCATKEGSIHAFEPAREYVEEFLLDDVKNITNGTTHVFFYAAKVANDMILLMRHPIFEVMDGGKLLTQFQFEKICKENNLINPW